MAKFCTFNGRYQSKSQLFTMTRSLYRTFILCFIISILAFAVFMTQYIQFFRHLIMHDMNMSDQQPEHVFSLLFSPTLIFSAIIMGLTSLTYKIIGIVFVAQKKELPGGEQALWIIGFIFIGFITAIVFMALGKSKQWINDTSAKYAV